MIGRILGVLLEKNPPQILIDCHGLGYEVHVPMSTFYHLPALGESVTLSIQQIVREDAHLLYGFATPAERSAFRELIKISGVGPRTALAVLSGLSVVDLAGAVARQEAALLTQVPGIGKKTAERLLLELKGKLGFEVTDPSTTTNAATGEILQALVGLGYSDKEAGLAVQQLPVGIGLSEGIKQALGSFSKTSFSK